MSGNQLLEDHRGVEPGRVETLQREQGRRHDQDPLFSFHEWT